MKFIDLYAGIGGFRYALESLGHTCVFSAEKDKHAIETYYNNFPTHDPTFDMDVLSTMSNDNIKKTIPSHDILCAGFPCQTFSVGGIKKGFEDLRGKQFFNILKILKIKRPKYIILENVKHITRHDNGQTYAIIKKELKKLGYDIGQKPTIISPESLGVPHRRERAFIYSELNTSHKLIKIPPKTNFINSIETIFKFSRTAKIGICEDEMKIVKAWDNFINLIGEKPPVVWLDQMLNNEWSSDWKDWKKKYILSMRFFYKKHKEKIDKWINEYKIMETSNVKYRRLEWLCDNNHEFSLKNKIITIRQSGVRVSKPDVFPTLVASVETPITFDYKLKKFREMSIEEMCKLQSFPKNFKPSKIPYQAKKQLGNSVNINVVKYIAKEFL